MGSLKDDYDYYDTSNQLTKPLNDYLQNEQIGVGIFNETTYGTRGIEAIIIDSGPKDRRDPISEFTGRSSQPALVEKGSANGFVIPADALAKSADPNSTSAKS